MCKLKFWVRDLGVRKTTQSPENLLKFGRKYIYSVLYSRITHFICLIIVTMCYVSLAFWDVDDILPCHRSVVWLLSADAQTHILNV